jgi:hypothetical protein
MASGLFFLSTLPQLFDRPSTGFAQGDKLVGPIMMRARWRLPAILLVAALLPAAATAQSPASRVLFRLFLTDGRVLASYGEWARVDDRVVFSMPTQLTREPLELHLVAVPAAQVDWRRTEEYAESVRAAAYAASRGDADFAGFTADVARALNEVSRIADPRQRLATAEQARRALAEWPASHYGYRIGEVRESLNVLDEVIAQLRVAAGETRFDISLSAPLAVPPPPPLPPPSDAELVEQFVAAASLAQGPAEKTSLLQTVIRVLDGAVAFLPAAWADGIRRSVNGDLDREQRVEQAYQSLRKDSLEAAAKAAAKGSRGDLERLRQRVASEDARLGRQRPAEIAALLATITLQAESAVASRERVKAWEKRAPLFRRYRRATNGSFDAFKDATVALEQVKAMSGPSVAALSQLVKRLERSGRSMAKVEPPAELITAHDLAKSAWDLALRSLHLRLASVAGNNMDDAQRASSAAAGALMLHYRARADLLAAMEAPLSR